MGDPREVFKSDKPYKVVCEIYYNLGQHGASGLEATPLYVCDGDACEFCSEECYLTQDREHAKRFDLFEEVIRRGN